MTDESQSTARELLAANEGFYRAFAARDFDRMDALWATAAPVTCIHPGWNAVRGRERVMATWRSILGSPESPDIACANATAHAQGELGYVVCEERLGDTMLIATNVFVRERGAWKLAHHQAGHVAAQVPEEPPFPPVAGGDHTVN